MDVVGMADLPSISLYWVLETDLALAVIALLEPQHVPTCAGWVELLVQVPHAPVVRDASFGHDHLACYVAMDEPSLECVFGVEGDALKDRQSHRERRKCPVIGRREQLHGGKPLKRLAQIA